MTECKFCKRTFDTKSCPGCGAMAVPYKTPKAKLAKIVEPTADRTDGVKLSETPPKDQELTDTENIVYGTIAILILVGLLALIVWGGYKGFRWLSDDPKSDDTRSTFAEDSIKSKFELAEKYLNNDKKTALELAEELNQKISKPSKGTTQRFYLVERINGDHNCMLNNDSMVLPRKTRPLSVVESVSNDCKKYLGDNKFRNAYEAIIMGRSNSDCDRMVSIQFTYTPEGAGRGTFIENWSPYKDVICYGNNGKYYYLYTAYAQ